MKLLLLYKSIPLWLRSLKLTQISDAEENESSVANQPRISAPSFHETSTLNDKEDNGPGYVESGIAITRTNEYIWNQALKQINFF